jgi:hypothetical protein
MLTHVFRFLDSILALALASDLTPDHDLGIGCMVKMASAGSTAPCPLWIQINPSRLESHGGTLWMIAFWVHDEVVVSSTLGGLQYGADYDR